MTADTAGIPAVAAQRPVRPAAASVLVIEDDFAFRDLLGMHLASAGYKVLIAEDAAVGGRMLLSSKPDLLVLDILLPFLGGLELLQALRLDPNVGQTPVVCVTSMRDDATYIKAMQLGAAAVLTKPVRADELLATVAKALKSSSNQE
ncbi:MAG: response regulator [Pseudomonadota bacterium]